jgi:hypothetical protein
MWFMPTKRGSRNIDSLVKVSQRCAIEPATPCPDVGDDMSVARALQSPDASDGRSPAPTAVHRSGLEMRLS